MENQFRIIRIAQGKIDEMLSACTIQQINKVPEGYKNNLIWNYAHVVASMQMLCYFRPGYPLKIDEAFVNAYKVGTKPEAFIDQEEFEKFKGYASKGIEVVEADYRNGYFKDFKPYVTATGFSVETIEFAISYSSYHYGLHQGFINALKKLVA